MEALIKAFRMALKSFKISCRMCNGFSFNVAG